MEKKLKIILCIVVIILIALIAFVGVYSKDGLIYKNNLPSYKLSSEFTGKRVTTFKVSDETEEKIYDKDGNEVDSIPEGANEEEYKKEQVKVNVDEKRNKENYEKVKKIFEGRLEALKIENYLVRLDNETGTIAVELDENDKTDTILQYLLCDGDFAIQDSKSRDVLIGKDQVKKATVLYTNTGTEGVRVFLNIKFNKEGAKRLGEISKEYLKPEDENSTEKPDKQVAIRLEGNDMLTTNFGEEMHNGELPITLGTSKESSEIQEYAEQ